uniref:BTB domain-containing protein n=1 Tax=Kalmanozyma brasiliensis (strain GHG001) TaxID=1365824 RepID=V5EKV7_KALBG
MSRLHTVILTDEKVSNVWVCGLGSNGRLGRSPQTQTSFEPLKDFHETAHSVAVAQDHTLIITSTGAVYSFGLNRFAQLGYTIEQGLGTVGSTTGKLGGAGVTFGQPAASAQNVELDIQISPRRIAGSLKKEEVLGAACSKLHSAVFTSEGLYTWGTNTGQLGYDRSGTAVQVQPRKVTALAAGAGIQQIAASDFGTACLMEGGDVFVWHNDTHFRINFPLARFSSSISVFRPRQVQPKTLISKLSSSGNTFSALSDMGDLFTFNLEHPSEYGHAGTSGRAAVSSASATKSSAAQSAPKPQLLWSVRKKFTAVRDVAIGADGSVILCTESGHCFVRPRRSDAGGKGGGGKNFKFQQIPYLQRVVKVATSESGALAAIKADPSLPDVRVKGRSVEEALRDLLPHLKVQTLSEDGQKQMGIASKVVEISDVRSEMGSDSESDDERADAPAARSDTGKYVRMALLIVEAAKRWVAGRMQSELSSGEAGVTGDASAAQAQPSSNTGRRQAFYGPHNLKPPFGCDAFLIADGHYLPVHKIVLGARIPLLQNALQDSADKQNLPSGVKISTAGTDKRVSILTLSNCSFVSALFLLHYIYSDDLPPIWVASVGLIIDKELKAAKIDRVRIQDELRVVADHLGLSALATSVKASMPRPPEPTLRANMAILFSSHVDVDIENMSDSKRFNDVVLRFQDRTVPGHSVILRRSPFFAALFQPHWTAARWDNDNVITLNMTHLRWEVARIVLMHLYTDNGETLFTGCDVDRSLEQYMDFLVEVMAAANELLLDKLKLVASSLLRKRVLAHTVGAVMTEADFYKAGQLKDITMDYCTKSMEALLEGGRLNELDQGMIRALTVYVRQKQDDKLHRTFAEDRLAALVEKHREFFDDLDVPPPSLHLVVNKVRPKKGSRPAGIKSPPLLAQGSYRRQSSARLGLTFAQIQEQQRLAIEAEQETIRQAAAARRSFLDIQEEERLADERRREEQKQAEEFERWFAEESKRLQKEQKANKGAAGGVKGKSQKKAGKLAAQQQQSKAGQDAAASGSANGSGPKPKGSKPHEGGKKGGANKPANKQANGAPANADGTPNKNGKKQRADAAEGGNKPSPQGKENGGSKASGADGTKPNTPSTPHGLPTKPAASSAFNPNLSAAAPTFTPRQP